MGMGIKSLKWGELVRKICSRTHLLRMVASPATIELLRRTAEADDDYQLLLRQIALGWPESAIDVPANLRQFMTFSDELDECDGLVFKGHRVVVPREARPRTINHVVRVLLQREQHPLQSLRCGS